jgi:chlorobactene glucosyltransferase
MSVSIRDIEANAVHACAAIAVAYAVRAASFGPSWIRVPVVRELALDDLVSIIVPARNEERSIEHCVRSLLAQSVPNLEVIVVDDRSTDRTPAILDTIAREDARLHVIRGAELPEGWVGKPWALHQGFLTSRGRWLLFTDADSEHEPHSASSAIAFAVAQDADALTISTNQVMGTLAERAILPSILGMIFFATGPFDAINDPAQPDRAIANGQYLLVERRAYEAIGGHAALAHTILEDVEFARRIKADGRYRLMLAGGEDLASVRMYHSLREIWDGFTKNVYLGPGGDLRALGAGFVFLSAISYVPPLLAIRAAATKRPWLALEALACTAATMATASWAVSNTCMPRRLGWFQPFGTAILAAITVNSTVLFLSGRGVEWRGRRYRKSS